MVHAYAYRRTVLATQLQKRRQSVVDPLQFGCILLVGIFQFLEHTTRIHEVAGIDAYFVGSDGGGKSRAGIEMDVGHQGHVDTGLTQTRRDHAYVVGLPDALRGEPHKLTAGGGKLSRLPYGAVGVHSGSVGHRLQAHGVVALWPHGRRAPPPSDVGSSQNPPLDLNL